VDDAVLTVAVGPACSAHCTDGLRRRTCDVGDQA
jgi:hypothetical protein